MSAPSTEVLFARCHDECVRLLAENERLRAALTQARQDILDWAEYAGDYIKAKWLPTDLEAIDAVLRNDGEGS